MKRIFLLSAFAALLASCSTKKNTVASRAYHNLTARYNGYYYSCENINEGVYKIEKNAKENYNKPLSVYIYPSTESAKSTFPEFDKAIKKSSLCIQKHAIKDKKGNEIPSAGKWIDNNWINIGIAHVYKREFFSGIEAFQYVIKTYTKSQDKLTAMIWLTKANNEVGAVSNSEQTLSFLKNEHHLPRKIKNEFPIVYADYYMRRGQNTEAIAKLMEVNRNKTPFIGVAKKRRARYSFIIAQLSEVNNDPDRAVEYYHKTIKLKPAYEMVFYSKIKIARLTELTPSNSEKIKKQLLKMTKEFKNSDYYDVIYYTLGEIEEKQRNQQQALFYYKRSVQTSVNNTNQKALSFLKLGEINFELTNYQTAEAYYDSTIAALPQDHPNYEKIVARKKTLGNLVTQINTIRNQDSLQRIAKMSEVQRNAYVDRMIENLKYEEERKQREAEAAKAAAANANNSGQATMPGMPGFNEPNQSGGAAFYFYNPNTVVIGISNFKKKWGNRKLEDNWRRSSKAMSIDEGNSSTSEEDGGENTQTASSEIQDREYYLKNLPLSDSLIQKSNAKIIKAYYKMGAIYKEELDNNKKAVVSFEELNSRFPDNEYLLSTYYMMYRIYQAEKNKPKEEYYKNKILNEFPDSEFAALIRNPEHAAEMNAKKSEVENFYANVFDSYHTENYYLAYTQAQEGISKFGKNDYLPKFEFIKSMSLGKIKGVDTLEQSLKKLVIKYPNAEVTPLANDVLMAIKKQKTPEMFQQGNENKTPVDTFVVSLDNEHFLLSVVPNNPKIADAYKNNLIEFNEVFYSDKKFDMKSNLLGKDKQMIVLKSFASGKEAMDYYENMTNEQSIFKGDVKRELIEVFPILSSNLPLFYQKKNVAGYKAFFEDNYKSLSRNNQPKK